MTYSINDKARKKKPRHGLNVSKGANLETNINAKFVLINQSSITVAINHLFHLEKKTTQNIFTYVAD